MAINWHIKGEYMEACSCDFLCPCIPKNSTTPATHDFCKVALAFEVWALAIANKMKMGAVAGMVSPYPTLGEVNKRAAGAYFTPRLFENDWVKRVVRFVQRF